MLQRETIASEFKKKKKENLLKLNSLRVVDSGSDECLQLSWETVQTERDKKHLIPTLDVSRPINTYFQPHDKSHPTAFAVCTRYSRSCCSFAISGIRSFCFIVKFLHQFSQHPMSVIIRSC